MLAMVTSFGLTGIHGYAVRVETDVSSGLPAFETVGLPDAAVKESHERVRAALKNSGMSFPMSHVTCNLAPADQKKEGSLYDLPIAIGILMATGELPAEVGERAAFLGELSLDGALRPVRGVLSMAVCAKAEGVSRLYLPRENAPEAACVEGLETVPVETLAQLVRVLKGEEPCPVPPAVSWEAATAAMGNHDFSLIRGQRMAKRALEVAAAGGHNALLIGPPGSGKTMLARAFPTILPELTFEEAVEVTQVHSIAGALPRNGGLVKERPFRSPHHNASVSALVGGGVNLRPGEISMAHHGVLFLDEFPEFSRDALEALRQPLEDGEVTISRAKGSLTYPAQALLVAAMNPCPCGNYGSAVRECRCSKLQIANYLRRISGPLLDRIDLQLELDGVPFEHLTGTKAEESSTEIRKRVNRARKIQQERYRGQHITCNAHLTARQLQRYCVLCKEDERLAKEYFTSHAMTARAYTRTLKVARTIADLEGADRIASPHLAEAFQYRFQGGKYWG